MSGWQRYNHSPDDKYPLPGDRIGKYAAIALLVFFTLYLAWHIVAAIASGAFTGSAPG